MPSLFSRLGQAARIAGRVLRGYPLPDNLWHVGYGMPAKFKPKESLEAYGDNVWLYAAVNKIAQELARTKIKLRTKAKDGFQYFEDDESDVLELINRPQPIVAGRSKLTGFHLRYITGMHLCLNGEAFWVMDNRRRVNGAPTRIDLLLPGNVYLKTDKNTGDLVSYIYRLPDREITIDPLDVVHFKLPDPLNWNRGHAPTQSVRYALDTYSEAELMNLKRLQNHAVPGGVLKTQDTKLDQEQVNRLREQWRSLYEGSENSGRMAILTKGMEFDPLQQSNADMQFMEGKNINRDEILANYGVGLEILGRTESQTRANAEAAIFVFMRFGALFFIECMFDTFNNDLKPAFPGNDKNEFCFDDPVPENMEEKRLNSQALMDSGALTPDEMRKLFGMEPLGIAGVTDVPYVNFSRVPAGQSPPDLAPLG
ncbi:MAG: phage portal protein [Pirellulales bacterium]